MKAAVYEKFGGPIEIVDAPEKIRCDACPVMCYIAPGQTGACDRYANDAGRIVFPTHAYRDARTQAGLKARLLLHGQL